MLIFFFNWLKLANKTSSSYDVDHVSDALFHTNGSCASAFKTLSVKPTRFIKQVIKPFILSSRPGSLSIHGNNLQSYPCLVKYSVCMSVCLILVYIAYVYSFLWILSWTLYICYMFFSIPLYIGYENKLSWILNPQSIRQLTCDMVKYVNW